MGFYGNTYKSNNDVPPIGGVKKRIKVVVGLEENRVPTNSECCESSEKKTVGELAEADFIKIRVVTYIGSQHLRVKNSIVLY